MLDLATYRNKSSILNISGFDELYQKLEQAGKNAEVEGRKLFEHCAENMYDELYDKGKAAGLPEHLLEEIEEDMREGKGRWSCEIGWKKSKPKTPLPDTYKVMFYNYGTPSGRHTKQGGQRVQINGKWVTLGTDRGKENAHPSGSHGFIKKAKLAAARKNKKLQKETLDKILGDLK